MKTNMKTTKILSAGVGILLILALIFSIALIFQKNSLKKSLVLEQSHGATLLAQKHALQKEVESYSSEISRLVGKNKELDSSLAESINKLHNAQYELNRLVRENSDKKLIQKKLQEVQALKDELEVKLIAMNTRLDELNNEKLALNSTISSLQNENREMAANLQMVQAVMANNFLIEALKGKKDKLTVSAKRTGKIKVDFEIPVAIQSQVHFKIIKPGGIVLDSQNDKNFTVIAQNSSIGSMASSSNAPGVPIKTKRINLTYKPDTKLRPGIYTIEVYNNDTYLGASQIKLK